MPRRAGEVLLGKYAAYQFMDKYRSDDDSRRIAPGDYECDENGCKESEGEKPFFDVLTTKLNLITGADYQESCGFHASHRGRCVGRCNQ